jgi:uncharacterized membrane protein
MRCLAQAIGRSARLLLLVSSTIATNGLAQPADPSTCGFQDLNIPGALAAAAFGINDAGAVVGSFSSGLRTGSEGFLLFGGRFTAFSFPRAIFTAAFDINNQSQIVGSYIDSAGSQHGFFVHAGGFQTIDVPGAVNGTLAMGINNAGDIVGGFFPSSGGESAFHLRQGKLSLFRFPSAVATEATSININSVIVGMYRDAVVGSGIHGFMVVNGVFTTLDFPGAVDTFPFKINDREEIVGWYNGSDSTQHGFAFINGKFITIDKPDEPPATQTQTNIRGINNLSQVVGIFSDSSILGTSAFQANCQDVF